MKIKFNFYSRASREARRVCAEMRSISKISTHAPLARRDVLLLMTVFLVIRISTHAPLARRDRYN